MKLLQAAFCMVALLMTAVVFSSSFVGGSGQIEETFVRSLMEHRVNEVVRDPQLAVQYGCLLSIVVCLFLMARIQTSAAMLQANRGIDWRLTAEAKVYGTLPWSRTKYTAWILGSILALSILAFTVPMGLAFAAFTLLLFASLSGTGFRVLADDKGFSWNRRHFAWDHVESWTRTYVPAYLDESNGHGEIWLLSVTLAGDVRLECEDPKGEYSIPFHEHVAHKYRESESIRGDIPLLGTSKSR